MDRFASVRMQILDRWNTLTQRLEAIESEAASRGFACAESCPGEEATSPLPVNAVLDAMLETTRHEAAMAQSAIHRIDRKEFDCCIQCGRAIGEGQLSDLPYLALCSECTTDFPRNAAEEFGFQHRSLRRAVEDVLEVFSQVVLCQRAERAARAEICAAAVLLGDLQEQLRTHLAFEERNGYMRAALDVAPHYQRQADALLQEHELIDRCLDQIRDEVAVADESPRTWDALAKSLRRFARDLHEHEAAENRLVRDALLQDEGGG